MVSSMRWVVVLSVVVACGDDDAASDAGGLRDSGGRDAAVDAGSSGRDAAIDAGGPGDSGMPDDVELYLLTVMNRLVRIGPSAPATLLGDVAITGLPTRQSMIAIDSRPMTGELFGLGSNGQLYVIDPMTGETAAAGSALMPEPGGMSFGFDFTPTFDRLRVSSDTGVNMRVNPEDGATVVDVGIAFAGGDPNAGMPLAVTALAYTNPVPMAPSTTLFGIDITNDVLVTIGGRDGMPSPNTGAASTVGVLGVDVNIATGFDVALDGRLYAALNRDAEMRSELYTINPDTGAATLIGAIGAPARIRGLAVALPAP